MTGSVVIRSADENRDARDPTSFKKECHKQGLPNTIQLACDEIVFEDGSNLQTWSHLRLYGGLISGPVTVTGLRNRNGASGSPITTTGDSLNGKDGADGSNGGDGQNAGSSLSRGIYHASAGGNGGNGTDGTPAGGEVRADGPRAGRLHAKDGNSGETGEHNVCITLQTENFDGKFPVSIDAHGGIGGDGSNGQDGGKGGNGGNGGFAGKGGDSDTIGGRSEHGGNGGSGGNGKNGSDGGDGGNGANGGDGGSIEVTIQEDQDGKGVRPATGTKLMAPGGEGGKPGIGGRKGLRGIKGIGRLGGAGGDGDHRIYNSANPGGAGSNGVDGQDGQDGQNGIWGLKGHDGEIVENVFGYGTVKTPNPVDWDIPVQ
ncbi:hypothetical protein E0H71_00360 [Rhizobium leguminosarum bv. viciae]|uniref:hypothetical protein n=1 Tax=Rhizobium leguminosarum TaxID=384 RepID=UPI00103C10B3|nr:hypothetical protein [Rhizobium leguminosarum]TCA58089.1 hypothetical protein E0H71_00360 [Rhizobium leguminosarum bv. viciae]